MLNSSTTRKILADEECFKIVRRKLDRDYSDAYELVSHEIVPISGVHGYMGQYFTLRTVVREKDTKDTREINFFIKIPPLAESVPGNLNLACGNFNKEVMIYNFVLPKLMDDETNSYVPDCFLAEEDSVIVLEDLQARGFQTVCKYKPLDFKHCSLIMKALGEFHAKSFVFEERNKNTLFDEFSHCMQETLFPIDNDVTNLVFDADIKGVLSMIDLVDDLNEGEKKLFKEKFAKLSMEHPKSLQPSKARKNVFCHGDLWANNFFFKYDSHGNPSDCCFVDFQLARHNPPAHDILYFLQCTTLRELRTKCLDNLLQIYHESVTKCLTAAGLDVASVFPWHELVDSVDDMRLSGMMHGVLNMNIILLNEAIVNKFNFLEDSKKSDFVFYSDRTPLVCGAYNEIPEYRDRMTELLLELYDHVFR